MTSLTQDEKQLIMGVARDIFQTSLRVIVETKATVSGKRHIKIGEEFKTLVKAVEEAYREL